MLPLDVTGLVAATFTPLTPQGQVEVNMIPAYAEYLQKKGVEHVFVNGATGESLSLSLEERKLLAEAWIKCRPSRIKRVMIHVGCNSLPEARLLAAHAQAIGADAVSAMAPCLFKPGTVESLVEFCRQVAEAAPETPFVFYHLPSLSGVNLDMVDFAKGAMERIPTFAGIKYSNNDMTIACILRNMEHQGQKMKLFYGSDQQFLCALAMGWDSAIGSTYNNFPELYQRMMDKFKAADMEGARQVALDIQRIVRLMFANVTSVPASKCMMNLYGFPVGPVRAPLKNLTTEERDQMKKDLNEFGYEKLLEES